MIGFNCDCAWSTAVRRRSQARVPGALRSAEANVARTASSVEEAKAAVTTARAGVTRAESDHTYAKDNLDRIEPLLTEQFVTVDQVLAQHLRRWFAPQSYAAR
jgi:multidrug efflux system membrane fusion protein